MTSSDGTRRDFIARTALAAATLCGVAAVEPFAAAAAAAAAAGSDADVLRFVLILEQLQETLFATRAHRLHLGPRARFLASQFAMHERTHVETVTAALSDVGATPAPPPSASFADAHDEASFFAVAVLLEDTAVTAYNGLLPTLKNKVALAQIGAILQVDARHAAALALLAHRSPTPYGAFDIPISKARAQERIARF